MTQLRRYLDSQPGPSTSDPVSLPPSLVSILLPQLHATSTTGAGTTSGSNTVTAALTQRTRILQEENDELYELLKQGETGKLKEEVRGLRRAVERLEGALRGPLIFQVSLMTAPHILFRIAPSNKRTVVSHFLPPFHACGAYHLRQDRAR